MKKKEKVNQGETMYSRDTQKLLYWLISDIANFNYGNKVGSTPTEYQIYEVKKQLKKEYLKLFDYKLVNKPLERYLKVLEDKDNKTIDQLQEEFIKAIQSVFLKNDDFSVALELMTQEKANKFVTFLFDLCLSMNIELRPEIVELLKEQDNKSYIYTCLKYNRCCACGREGSDLHHYDNVARIGGYKFDDGTKLRVMPLCRVCHSKEHSNKDFLKEKGLVGIRLSEEEVLKISSVYKNQFKALKK